MKKQDEPTHERALELIREALAGPTGEPRVLDLAELIESAQDAEQGFRSDVRQWVVGAKRAQRDGWDFEDVWRNAFKPWLTLIVGWRARSELGKLAGEEGYNMLFRHLESLWE